MGGGSQDDAARRRRFEATALPHLDAAYNLARWLTRNDADAEDVVQDAVLRAFRFFDGFRGDSAKAWLLTIVRRTAYGWLQRNRAGGVEMPGEEAAPWRDAVASATCPETEDPELRLLDAEARRAVNDLIAALPPSFREVVVLRDIEGLSYREIAVVTEVPIGTVMSRLARARRQLQRAYAGQAGRESVNEV
jgi:RNA polymerase sigma-70 factor (ECF subfamily)